MNEILGFLPFFYLGFWGFQISPVQVQKFKHDANTRQHQKLGMWQWCCSCHSSSTIVRTMFFPLFIHLTGVSCFHLSSLILSSFPSFLNWRAVWNPSYPLCHSFNSSGGSVLLISSSNIPSSQVHVLFLPCSTGVLPEFFPSHLVLTGVVSNSILSIKLLIHVFATFKFS